jgi:uncharacterized protein
MPRPRKHRCIEFLPRHTYFKPAGVPLRSLNEVVLPAENVEALRLKDVEGLEQEECARRMGISRRTLARILDEARCKVTTALLEGMAIRIESGDFEAVGTSDAGQLRCRICGRRWEGNPASIEEAPVGETSCLPDGETRHWRHGGAGHCRGQRPSSNTQWKAEESTEADRETVEPERDDSSQLPR